MLEDARIAMVTANVDLLAAWRSDHAQQTAGEAWRLASTATGRICTYRGDEVIEGIQFPLLEPFPTVERLSNGRWLIVNCRSRGDGNARILGPDGIEQRRIELGDGIQHAQVDALGRIWVGWFDEGVFGNDNWRVAGLEWAPSACGMAAFDDHGALVERASLASVADCYALNAFGAEAWACTYPDFPIWRMKDGTERVWPTNLRGAEAIAVSYPHILAAGGYGDDANRIVLMKLEEDWAVTLGEWTLPLGMGGHRAATLIDGRNDELHVVQDEQWHRWRVADFVSGQE